MERNPSSQKKYASLMFIFWTGCVFLLVTLCYASPQGGDCQDLGKHYKGVSLETCAEVMQALMKCIRTDSGPESVTFNDADRYLLSEMKINCSCEEIYQQYQLCSDMSDADKLHLLIVYHNCPSQNTSEICPQEITTAQAVTATATTVTWYVMNEISLVVTDISELAGSGSLGWLAIPILLVGGGVMYLCDRKYNLRRRVAGGFVYIAAVMRACAQRIFQRPETHVNVEFDVDVDTEAGSRVILISPDARR